MDWQVVHRLSLGALAAGVLAVAAGIGAMPARAFPDDQLDRGEAVWQRACDRCHGENSPLDQGDKLLLDARGYLETLPFATDVAGHIELHGPENGSGPLSDQECLDVTAYLLHMNGYGRDETEPLTADREFVLPTDNK